MLRARTNSASEVDFIYSVLNGQLVPSDDPLDSVIKDTGEDERPSQVWKVF